MIGSGQGGSYRSAGRDFEFAKGPSLLGGGRGSFVVLAHQLIIRPAVRPSVRPSVNFDERPFSRNHREPSMTISLRRDSLIRLRACSKATGSFSNSFVAHQPPPGAVSSATIRGAKVAE